VRFEDIDMGLGPRLEVVRKNHEHVLCSMKKPGSGGAGENLDG
jgi:hypothetical protein